MWKNIEISTKYYFDEKKLIKNWFSSIFFFFFWYNVLGVSKMKKIYYLYISIFCFCFFFVLSIFIVNGNTLFFDMPSYTWCLKFRHTNYFLFCTTFGEAKILIPLVLVSFFLFKNKSHWKFLAAMMTMEVILNSLLKFFFSRPRPAQFSMIEETGYSFPSGHMMASTMFYGLCIYFLWQTHWKKIWKILITFVLTFLILSIGISRVYLGVHYMSDILGGFLLSLCFLSFGIFFYRSMNHVKQDVK